MSTLEQRYRRNFILAVVLHVAIVGGVVVVEKLPVFADHQESPPAFVEAALLGEAPEGNGTGLGPYKAPDPLPAPAPAPAPAPSPASAPVPSAPSDESAAPEPKVATPVHSDPSEVLLPAKKSSTKKPATETPTKTVAKSTTPTKTTTAKKPAPAVASAGKTSGNGTGTGADEFRRRFASALTSYENGTPGGDNKPGGGGKGKGGNVGSPNGVKNGVPGGVGQGSANWEYFRQVHDVLYQAWDQPDSALDKKLMTTVALRVARDGSIADASVRVGSGNKSMDASVLAAVRKVPRLDPPPDVLMRGEYAVITVNFQAEG